MLTVGRQHDSEAIAPDGHGRSARDVMLASALTGAGVATCWLRSTDVTSAPRSRRKKAPRSDAP
jgi:hypothetical protein